MGAALLRIDIVAEAEDVFLEIIGELESCLKLNAFFFSAEIDDRSCCLFIFI